MGLLCLVGCGVAAGADRPDRFVGDDRFLDLLVGETVQRTAELRCENRLDLAGIALFERLADAENRGHQSSVSGVQLAVDQGVGLAEELPAFAVSQHDETHEERAEHRGADLAGESACGLEVHVLRAQLHVLGRTEHLGHLGKRGERGQQDDVDAQFALDLVEEVLDEGSGLGDRLVHLPVRRDDLLSHKRITH